MRAMTRRALALVLTLAMALSLCLAAQAAGPPGDGDPGWDGAGAGGPRLYRRAGPDPGAGDHRPPAGADLSAEGGGGHLCKGGGQPDLPGWGEAGRRHDYGYRCRLSGSVGYVPLVYLARFFLGSRWLGTESVRTVSLTGSAGLTVADISSIQAYTDMTFYGQGLVSVEITYRPGVDVSGVTAQSYILEDRGTLSPDFGRIEIAGVSVQGQTVTLSIAENTGATSNNKMIYTGDQKEGSRERNAFGIYCTGAWYRDVNGVIYYGKEDTAEYRAKHHRNGLPGPALPGAEAAPHRRGRERFRLPGQ